MIVGIYSSSPQSGKSTVSDTFVEAGFKRLSLATPVKESLAVVLKALQVDQYERYLWGDWKEKVIPGLGVTGGYLMSSYATTFFRNTIDEHVWLECLINEIDDNEMYVVDDMRFYNEYMTFDYSVRVDRPNTENKTHSRTANSEGRLSLLDFDYVIINDSNLDDLKRFTKDLILDIKLRDGL